MPTIPSTVEIPIGRFIKYVAIIFIAGIVAGIILGVTGVTTNWPHALAGTLWQFFIVDNLIITLIPISVLTGYILIRWKTR